MSKSHREAARAVGFGGLDLRVEVNGVGHIDGARANQRTEPLLEPAAKGCDMGDDAHAVGLRGLGAFKLLPAGALPLSGIADVRLSQAA